MGDPAGFENPARSRASGFRQEIDRSSCPAFARRPRANEAGPRPRPRGAAAGARPIAPEPRTAEPSCKSRGRPAAARPPRQPARGRGAWPRRRPPTTFTQLATDTRDATAAVRARPPLRAGLPCASRPPESSCGKPGVGRRRGHAPRLRAGWRGGRVATGRPQVFHGGRPRRCLVNHQPRSLPNQDWVGARETRQARVASSGPLDAESAGPSGGSPRCHPGERNDLDGGRPGRAGRRPLEPGPGAEAPVAGQRPPSWDRGLVSGRPDQSVNSRLSSRISPCRCSSTPKASSTSCTAPRSTPEKYSSGMRTVIMADFGTLAASP